MNALLMMSLDKMMSTNWFLLVIMLLGMLCHFIKQFQAQRLAINERNPAKAMWQYFFKMNFPSTLLTFIACLVLFFIMHQMKEQGIMTAFTSGYMADSLFNKAEERGLKL